MGTGEVAEAANRAFWAARIAEARAGNGSVEFDLAEVPRVGNCHLAIDAGGECGLMIQGVRTGHDGQTDRFLLTVIP